MPNADRKSRRGFYGWTNVALLFFIYGAVYGFVFYGFSVVFPEMIRTQAWARGDAAMAHTIRAFLLGLFAPIVALAIKKFGARKTMIAGLLLGVAVLGALGSMTSKQWHWVLLWGVLMPISFSFGGSLPIQTTLTYWFSERRATALGIVLSASAFGGFVAAPLYTWIMREAGTWKAGWLAAGAFCSLSLIACLFVRDKPSDIGQLPDGLSPDGCSDTSRSMAQKRTRTYRTSESWELKEVIRLPVLYFFGFSLIAQTSALYLVTTHGVLHFTDLGFTPMQAATAIGVLMLFSGLARFPMGILGDRIEPRWILATAYLGMAVTTFGTWKAPGDFWLVLVITSGFGFCLGSILPVSPTLVANYFGPSAFAPIYGLLSPALVFFGAPVPLLAGVFYDRYHSYDIAFKYVTVITLVAAFLAAALVPPKRSKQAPADRSSNGRVDGGVEPPSKSRDSIVFDSGSVCTQARTHLPGSSRP